MNPHLLLGSQRLSEQMRGLIQGLLRRKAEGHARQRATNPDLLFDLDGLTGEVLETLESHGMKPEEFSSGHYLNFTLTAWR